MIAAEDLRGKTALVTGGARRIGATIGQALLDAGVNLVLHYRHSAVEAEAFRADATANGVTVQLVRGDLSEPGMASKIFAEAVALAGPIDFLINNASIFPEGTLASLDAAALAENMQVHALAPLELARALHAQGRPGAIVNLIDARIKDYDKTHVAYHLSKKTLATLTRMMAVDYAPLIRVNAICPGLVLPPEGKDESYLAGLAHTNPLQRFGDAEDVAAALIFLIRSDFITGQSLYIDGGRHLRGSFYGD